ncbi:MAG: hypothetical protein LAO31_03310 [Acidobacteriia bacterium]|nr:hypothetical protein [Terriglobia bacterium]
MMPQGSGTLPWVEASGTSLALRSEKKKKVLPIESGDKEPGLAKAELEGDVAANFGRGRGGECNHAGATQVLDRGLEPQVIGTKVMPPLGNAVRLVHCEQVHLKAREPFGKHPAPKALRRYVEEFVGTAAERRDADSLFFQSQRGVDEGGGNRAPGQGVDLVLHQSDQGRDDQGDPSEGQGRKLVAK